MKWAGSRTRAVALGIGCSAVFLWLALRRVDVRQTFDRLRQLDVAYLLLPLAMTSVNFPLRGWRWQKIFPPASRPTCWMCFKTLLVGNAMNNILPARGGDLARCVLASRRVSLEGSSIGLATLGIERLLDGLALMTIMLFSFRVITPPHWMWRLAGASAIVFAAAVGVLLALRHRSPSLLVYAQAVLARLGFRGLGERLAHAGAAFADGLHVVDSLRQMTVLVLITGVIWATEAGLICGLARALHLPLSLAGGFLVCAVLGLGLMIPAAPGSVGTYEFFSVAALTLVGMSAANALALTLVLHAWVLLTTTVAGMMFVGSRAVMLRGSRSTGETIEIGTHGVAPARASERT